MTDQLDIYGNAQPTTWDGEPVYSPATVAEGLFDPSAFEQMPGQLPFEDATDAFSGPPIGYRGPLWFRFIPDTGEPTSFSADSIADAQRFAAEHFHGRRGALFGPLEIRS